VRDEIVPPTESEDSGEVFRSTHSGRTIAASISVAVIALLIIGLVYLTTAPTAGEARGLGMATGASVGATPTAHTPVVVADAAARPADAIAQQASTTSPIESAGDPIAPLARPVVVLYGDSLAWEASDSFNDSFAGHPDVQVHTRTFGGTAICDWLDQMASDAASLTPGIVVIEFSGNSFTPCMHDANGTPLTGPAVDERYAVDAASVIATFSPIGTHVVLAGAPVSGSNSAAIGRLNSIYSALADDHDSVSYADAGRSVLAGDSYTITLPCLSSEPCDGGYNSDGLPVNVVRSSDGIHFCPVSGEAVQGITDNCPVWSSGAYRYGRALAQPVLDALAASSFD
jgi:hypothetical protein